jgi:ribosome-associated toxin RatA of RatAB toxin-antitoxin module
MKDLSATATGTAQAPIERVFERLSDIECYPDWYPSGVKHAEVLERGPDGEIVKVKTTLAVAQGPIQRDFKLHMAVSMDPPRTIDLRRLPKSSDDHEQMRVIWRLAEDSPERTRITVDLSAALSIPRFMPVGGIADSLAQGFLRAAVDAVR